MMAMARDRRADAAWTFTAGKVAIAGVARRLIGRPEAERSMNFSQHRVSLLIRRDRRTFLPTSTKLNENGGRPTMFILIMGAFAVHLD
jgi:hypothetical protein